MTDLVCLNNLLKKYLSTDLLARLQLAYTVADARRWSNFPPVGYRDRVGVTLAEFTLTTRTATLMNFLFVPAIVTSGNYGARLS